MVYLITLFNFNTQNSTQSALNFVGHFWSAHHFNTSVVFKAVLLNRQMSSAQKVACCLPVGWHRLLNPIFPAGCADLMCDQQRRGARWAAHSVEILNLNLVLAQGNYFNPLGRKWTFVRSWEYFRTCNPVLDNTDKLVLLVSKANVEMVHPFPPHLDPVLQCNMSLLQ